MCPRTTKQNEEIRQEKRQHILDAALKLFADNGFHATSISSIAKEAGISKGLMYNYFENKEALLRSIADEISTDIMNMMNPDQDDEITTQEMKDFFTLLFESLQEKIELWKLYFQISMQKDVLKYLTEQQNTEKSRKNNQLLYKYFAERFEKPEVELMLFSSLFKGFSMQYVLAPTMFNTEMIESFKNKLISLIVKDKIS
jgi:AcrR family transcriptional regulator